jgi:hypothetical protein
MGFTHTIVSQKPFAFNVFWISEHSFTAAGVFFSSLSKGEWLKPSVSRAEPDSETFCAASVEIKI